MIRLRKMGIPLLLMTAALAGCWDLREPNQLAYITGGGLDYTADGRFELISQVAIPAVIGGGQDGGGSGGKDKKSFYVVSATGNTIMDAGQYLQTRLSRQLFYGHREVIIVGQRMAEHGLREFTDMYIRNPKSELRSRIYIVKGGEAKEILATEPIFDPYTASALVNEQSILNIKPYYFRNFLMDVLSQGSHPLLPAVSITPTRKFKASGTAAIDKHDGLKLVGFLGLEETLYTHWMMGKISNLQVTSFIPEGNGYATLSVGSLHQRIQAVASADQIHIRVKLSGQGAIIENNTELNPAKEEDLRKMEAAFSQSTQHSVERLVEKVQKQFKIDVLGFGERVHEQLPRKWKTLRQDWDQVFPGIRVSVTVKLQCEDPGITSSSFR